MIFLICRRNRSPQQMTVFWHPTGIGSARVVPDVAVYANGHTDMAIVISEGDGKYMVRDGGSTSAAAPLWAGLIARADQYAGRHLGFANPAIYASRRAPPIIAHPMTPTGASTPCSSRR
jgi:subtilase family serine protease